MTDNQLPRWVIEYFGVAAGQGQYCVKRTDMDNHYVKWANGNVMTLSKEFAQKYADWLNSKV